jgi:hypothetical protein
MQEGHRICGPWGKQGQMELRGAKQEGGARVRSQIVAAPIPAQRQRRQPAHLIRINELVVHAQVRAMAA